MRLARSLNALASFTPERFEDIRRNIDPEWIDQALHATDSATLRRRRLPAAQVIWLVIGMALFRNRSFQDIVAKLNLALPGRMPHREVEQCGGGASAAGGRAGAMDLHAFGRRLGPRER
jgi:transposase IS4-like protein